MSTIYVDNHVMPLGVQFPIPDELENNRVVHVMGHCVTFDTENGTKCTVSKSVSTFSCSVLIIGF